MKRLLGRADAAKPLVYIKHTPALSFPLLPTPMAEKQNKKQCQVRGPLRCEMLNLKVPENHQILSVPTIQYKAVKGWVILVVYGECPLISRVW